MGGRHRKGGGGAPHGGQGQDGGCRWADGEGQLEGDGGQEAGGEDPGEAAKAPNGEEVESQGWPGAERRSVAEETLKSSAPFLYPAAAGFLPVFLQNGLVSRGDQLYGDQLYGGGDVEDHGDGVGEGHEEDHGDDRVLIEGPMGSGGTRCVLSLSCDVRDGFGNGGVVD